MRIALSILLASVLTGGAFGDEVYLRNSIGATSATTNGNGWYTSTYDFENYTLYLAPVQLQGIGTHDARLTRIRAIVSPSAPLGLLPFTYVVRVWDSWSALISDPRNGSVRNIPFDTPSSLQPYGFDSDMFQTYEAVFNIASSDAILASNGVLWLAIEVGSPDVDTIGIIGIMESAEPQPPPPNDDPDRQLNSGFPGGWRYTTDPFYSSRLFDGRLAYEVIGETLGASCPGDRGDANCDGALDFFDIDPFLTALFDPATYAAGFCGGSICAADADCSEVVDFFDIDPFLNCLFSGCAPCP